MGRVDKFYPFHQSDRDILYSSTQPQRDVCEENKQNQELESVSKAAALSAEIAAINIQKYLVIQSGGEGHRRMRMYEDMINQSSKVVEESVKAAQHNLEVYLKLKRSRTKPEKK